MLVEAQQSTQALSISTVTVTATATVTNAAAPLTVTSSPLSSSCRHGNVVLGTSLGVPLAIAVLSTVALLAIVIRRGWTPTSQRTGYTCSAQPVEPGQGEKRPELGGQGVFEMPVKQSR